MTILISGAGLSSLLLAQGLRASVPPIPFKIFERDSSPSSRPQGYRIRLSAEAGEAIKSVVSDRIWEMFEKSCAKSERPFGVRLGEDGMELGGMPGGAPPMGGGGPPPQIGRFYTVDRSVLRQVLLTDLESDISWSSEVTSYTTSPSSSTATLNLLNLPSIPNAQLIIGADSFRSPIRKQLVPHHKILDTGVRAIYGKTPLASLSSLPSEEFERKILDGMTIIKDSKKNLTLLLEPIIFPRNTPPPLPLPSSFKFPEDYVYFVLATSSPSPSSLFSSSPSTSLHSSLLSLTSHWSPPLLPLLQNALPTSLNPLKILSSSPSSSPPWEQNDNITLMGDSIHLMSPTGGQGAITALIDAAFLTRAIRSAWDGGEGGGLGGRWKEALGEYEEGLRERGKGAVERSFEGGRNMLGMKRWEECGRVEV